MASIERTSLETQGMFCRRRNIRLSCTPGAGDELQGDKIHCGYHTTAKENRFEGVQLQIVTDKYYTINESSLDRRRRWVYRDIVGRHNHERSEREDGEKMIHGKQRATGEVNLGGGREG